MKKKVKIMLASAMLVLFSGGVFLEVSAQRVGETGYKKWNGDNCCSGEGNCLVTEPGNC